MPQNVLKHIAMNITEIKTQLGVAELNLNTATNAEGVKTDWMRHWDNNKRIAVSIHKELLAEIQKDNSISDLALQDEVRTAEQGDYTAYRIVKYTAPEARL